MLKVIFMEKKPVENLCLNNKDQRHKSVITCVGSGFTDYECSCGYKWMRLGSCSNRDCYTKLHDNKEYPSDSRPRLCENCLITGVTVESGGRPKFHWWIIQAVDTKIKDERISGITASDALEMFRQYNPNTLVAQILLDDK